MFKSIDFKQIYVLFKRYGKEIVINMILIQS